MTLESWDPLRRRRILYANQDDMSADCKANPFERNPGKIFLDTNIVNLIVKWPKQVFEHFPVPMGVDRQTGYDIETPMHVFYTGQRAYRNLTASAKTIDEISNTPEYAVRKRLLDYAIEVVDQVTEGSRRGRDLGRHLSDSALLGALPDPSDRELLGNAIGMG